MTTRKKCSLLFCMEAGTIKFQSDKFFERQWRHDHNYKPNEVSLWANAKKDQTRKIYDPLLSETCVRCTFLYLYQKRCGNLYLATLSRAYTLFQIRQCHD
ncbi:hypothetical protein TNIN_188871 [Trichonephila inaurata madagascariensis]|uniref:Uncharacterized protein n=1 Tax=Trichonephila inaurata madagascariensis TaxID=2747483 RepID=A0A8X7BWM0_9ARAC|nr:hypothetical protein TNIN_188871 [Trichonephila inaurata madagascariensis]